MLSEPEKQELKTRCDLSNHVVVQIDEFLSPASTITRGTLKISDPDWLHALVQTSKRFGYDLQSLFEVDGNEYLSLFIDPANIHIQTFFLNYVQEKEPECWQSWVTSNIADVIVSFPVLAKAS